MGIGKDFIGVLKDVVKLTDAVDGLKETNKELKNRVEHIHERVIVLETRLNTYVEIAQSNRIQNNP